ncbi:substrate-binding domain-containing protein [Georgenia sp. TF02-10]|uniref:substrate-binding domain-containing protein n=1 Tax=Georgenia sp. TF02-10 TaxID=2917725 RepID=UPI001FA7BA6C|nr:substrate-binding domain-containing protein [Georgenia sp. TF02-10]UNX53736.1 substrate-binding domain-containing protein [Georgenia sp. TF02-10]
MITAEQRRQLPASRRALLLEALHRDGAVAVADLVDELGVSAVTVRRDIAQLVREGRVRRVHGGATLPWDGPRLRAGQPRADGDRASDGSGPSNGHATVASPASTDGHAPAPDRAAVGRPGGTDPDGTPATGHLAMLVPSLDYYWPSVARGAEEEARRHGLRVLLRGSSYDSPDERPLLARLAETDGVRGLLLAPNMAGPHAPDLVEWVARCGLPVVLVERAATHGPHHQALESAVSDHALGAEMAVRHLADLGHRRIGLVTSHQSPTARHVRTGWDRARADLDLAAEETVEVRLPERRSAGFEAAVAEVLAGCRATSTTALLVHSDPEAMAVVQHAADRGWSVPGDLSVVAYDDEVAGLASPALTAVRPPRRAVGRAAVQLLAARLAEPDRPVHRVLVSPELVLRESSGPPSSGGDAAATGRYR